MWYLKMWLQNSVNQDKTSSKFLSFVVILAVLCDFLAVASRPGCSAALGMQDKRIQDSQLSSYSSDRGYYPSSARLFNTNAWCSDSERPWTEYLQIRLDKIRHISGIATQGFEYFFNTYWVYHYSIQYSFDGRVWYWYKESVSGVIVKFKANTDATSVKRISLRDTFVTKYLRIYPTSFKDDMCMRIELYGCPDDKDCSTMLSQPSGNITSPNYPLPYPRGTDCTWIIQLPDKLKQVVVMFKYFDVNNGTSNGCDGDYVEAINGIRDVSPSLGRVCNGVDTPIFKSTGEVMRLHFHSDWHSTARKGFWATYYSGDVFKRATACTGSNLSLNCSSSSKSIKILHAFYGILPFSSTCGSPTSGQSCLATGSLNTVKTICEHYKVCNVHVASPLFSLSCGAGRVPHLDVYYQCTGTVIKTLAPTTIAPSTTNPPPTTTTTNHPTPTTTDTTTFKPLPATEPVTTPIKTIGSPSSTPTVSATQPGDGGDKLASVKEKNKTGMVVGIVVAVLLIIIVLVVLLVWFLYRRRKNKNEKPTAGVTYTAPHNSFNVPPPVSRNARGSSRTNPYETVNILYVSADDPAHYKDEEPEHIYDSPELQEPLPKMTTNPLYHGFESQEASGYENIDKAKPPPSLDPAIYDKPLPAANPKSATGKSISNPNYGKSIEIIPDK